MAGLENILLVSVSRYLCLRYLSSQISADVSLDEKLGSWVGKTCICVCISLLASPLLELTVRALQSELVDFTDVIILFLAKCFVYFMFMVLDQGKRYVGNTGTMICANW